MVEPLEQLKSATIVSIELPSALAFGGLEAIRSISDQLPSPGSLPSGTMVAIPGRLHGVQKPTMLQRMTGRLPATIHRAARCTALLAKGYVHVGGGVARDKTDWAWGFAP